MSKLHIVLLLPLGLSHSAFVEYKNSDLHRIILICLLNFSGVTPLNAIVYHQILQYPVPHHCQSRFAVIFSDYLCSSVSMSQIMKYHGCRSHMRDQNKLTGQEDRFDLVVDSNDVILERVV